VHGADDVQLGQPSMRQLAFDQRLRDHAHHAPAGSQGAVGQDTHHADVARAVNQLQSAYCQRSPKRGSAGGVLRPAANR
jgi:hypothetical protein